MRLDRVAVLGGGPGGLYAARLCKLARPDCEVVVHEQGVPDETFGFGVGLAARTQRRLAEADPASLDDILAASWSHDMRMVVGGRAAGMSVSSLVAVGRAELLRVLQRHAEDAGVKLEFGARRSADELDADLVIAADGVGSATRSAGDFGADVETGTGWYLWAGTDVALPHALFAPERTEHGVFVTHAYPYAADRSTFLVETDEATYRAAGFDHAVPADESDTVALEYLSDVFADHLDGHRLIGNRTRWMQFRTVRCDRWHAGNVVLLGDAAHTAHYSVGSGTKLAMEDAIALVGSLQESDDLESALSAYEDERRPAVARIQDIAERSRRWWETFPERLDLPVEQLLVAYMSRAGNVPLDRFAAGSPELVAMALQQWAGEEPPSGRQQCGHADTGRHDSPNVDSLAEWALARALRPSTPGQEPEVEGEPEGSRGFDSRVVADDPQALDATVLDLGTDERPSGSEEVVEDAVRRGSLVMDTVWLTGADDRASVLTRLEVAERLRRQTPALVVVAGPEALRHDFADGLVADRAHLVALR
ncbi:FAD-dependent monooxygenase [Actinomycetospora termitidis]|uniref:FAD-dependent monooxygenase n=1 Tax=Actinomycetospora termitidis TaxID=3053470 RepID=A0ABT7MF52_9PSEU|nr:FAD-dependent monooxygenase [Actinomycetospora sp. Odt1-22]MDL5159291.1 FAD-dependent monooxygenase [Actinomycetospora sp. Odt1-22]